MEEILFYLLLLNAAAPGGPGGVVLLAFMLIALLFKPDRIRLTGMFRIAGVLLVTTFVLTPMSLSVGWLAASSNEDTYMFLLCGAAILQACLTALAMLCMVFSLGRREAKPTAPAPVPHVPETPVTGTTFSAGAILQTPSPGGNVEQQRPATS